jgi:hypothetical protein
MFVLTSWNLRCQTIPQSKQNNDGDEADKVRNMCMKKPLCKTKNT